VTSFAYPFSQYDQRVVAAVKAAGFTSARSTWPGMMHSKEGLPSLTGLLRTETEKSLVEIMERYLDPGAVRGTVHASVELRPHCWGTREDTLKASRWLVLLN